jgi:hypothetical protein
MSARFWWVLALGLGLPRALAAQAVDPGAEPGIAAVLRMVQKAAQSSSPEHVRSLARRARLAGLMPSLRLEAERGLKQDLSASSSTAAARTSTALGDDVSLDASLTFDLPRLVFATEEVRLLSVERWLAQDRRKLFEEVVRLYFKRKRLLIERSRAAAPDPELDAAIAESEALLDALTDGAFGRALADRPHRER